MADGGWWMADGTRQMAEGGWQMVDGGWRMPEQRRVAMHQFLIRHSGCVFQPAGGDRDV